MNLHRRDEQDGDHASVTHHVVVSDVHEVYDNYYHLTQDYYHVTVKHLMESVWERLADPEIEMHDRMVVPPSETESHHHVISTFVHHIHGAVYTAVADHHAIETHVNDHAREEHKIVGISSVRR